MITWADVVRKPATKINNDTRNKYNITNTTNTIIYSNTDLIIEQNQDEKNIKYNIKKFNPKEINELVQFRINRKLTQAAFAKLINVSYLDIKDAELSNNINESIYNIIKNYIKKNIN